MYIHSQLPDHLFAVIKACLADAANICFSLTPSPVDSQDISGCYSRRTRPFVNGKVFAAITRVPVRKASAAAIMLLRTGIPKKFSHMPPFCAGVLRSIASAIVPFHLGERNNLSEVAFCGTIDH